MDASATMAATEKTAEQLRREIDELYRRQREITERLRDPRGLRKAALGNNLRNPGPVGLRQTGLQRGLVRRMDDLGSEDQPPAKKRISSAVVKLNDDPPNAPMKENAENPDDHHVKVVHDNQHQEQVAGQNEFEEGEINGGRRPPFLARRDSRRGFKEADTNLVEPTPRVLTKEENPSLIKRNQRMFGALLGTLQRFAAEDEQRSSSEAFARRSEMLKRAEQKSHEESERLRQQEREQIAEKRRRDLSLRARLAAKAEEKQLELLFIRWTEYHSKLSKILRTKSEPHIYYMPAVPTEELSNKVLENQQKEFLEWKNKRREELSNYQKELTERYLSNLEVEIEKWVNRRNSRNVVAVKEDDQQKTNDENSHRRSKVTEEEEEDAEEDFMADDDMDGNVLGEDPKEQENETELKGIVEYISGDEDVTGTS